MHVNHGGSLKKRISTYAEPVAAALATILGAVVLVEWAMNSLRIARISSEFIPMAPATAICSVLISVVLIIRWWRSGDGAYRLVWSVLAAFALLISSALLLQYIYVSLMDSDLDAEQMLVSKSLAEQGFFSGRMSPMTALMFILLSAAALVPMPIGDKGLARYLVAQTVAAAVFILSLVLIVGYSYGAPLLYGADVTPVALTTSIAFLLLSFGYLFECDDAIFFRWVTSDSIVARFTRLMVPGTTAIIILSRWLRPGLLASSEPIYFSLTALLDAGLIILLIVLAARKVQAAVTRSQEELRATSSRQEAILDAVPDIIMEVDMDKVYRWANQTGMEFFGEDIIGKEAADYFEGEQDTCNTAQSVFNGREDTVYVESWQRRHDGQERLLAWWWRTLKDENGQVTGALSSARDITELKQTEQERTRQQELLMALNRGQQHFIASKDESVAFGDLLSDLLAITDSEYGFIGEVLFAPEGHPYLKTHAITNIAWNEETRDFYEKNAPNGMEFRNLKTLFGAALTTGEPVIANDLLHDPRRGGLPKGHPNLNAFLGVPISSAGKLVAMVGVANRPDGYDQGQIDFLQPFLSTIGQLVEARRHETDRVQAEEASRRTAREWQTTFDATYDAIWILDKEQRILRVNKTAEQLFRLQRDEMIGSPCWEIMHGSNEPIPDCPFERVRKSLRREGLELQTGDAWFAVNVDPILDDAGQFAGAVHIASDITERKQAEEEKEKLQQQLAQAGKMEAVGRLAGGVAHDFNNMLGAIIGNAEMAMMEIPEDTPLYNNLQEILKAARRSADLTRQLLAFARKQNINPQVLDLNEVAGSLLKMLKRILGEDIKLEWKPGTDLAPVKIDPTQVDQLLVNLAVNARDAIDGVGNMMIETEDVTFDQAYCRDHAGFIPGEYVQLAVSDDGCGMRKEVLDQLFQPFFTTKETGKGTGLGLATVYGIVKQNNGFVNVYSEPGQGTTFRIYLPSVRGEGVAEQKVSSKESAGGTETVLIVEDETAILDISKRALEGAGYTILAANTPGEAIRLATEYSGTIHLIVTDVVMPEMNGRDLRDKLQSLRPGIKVLFMSGYTSNVIAQQGVLDAGVDFLQKPFSVNALKAKVRMTLDG